MTVGYFFSTVAFTGIYYLYNGLKVVYCGSLYTCRKVYIYIYMGLGFRAILHSRCRIRV